MLQLSEGSDGLGSLHMPEMGWRFSYLAVLVVMVLICVVLYRGFRRSGWL
jgi:magnesium transporter